MELKGSFQLSTKSKHFYNFAAKLATIELFIEIQVSRWDFSVVLGLLLLNGESICWRLL